MTRVLILGAGGMLGADLHLSAPAGWQISPRTRAEVDVTSRDALARAIRETAPQVVINASGYTKVDQAETDFNEAMAVNGDAVATLAVLCAEAGVRFVHFSTDYVFDGRATRPYREDDAVHPLSRYGESKLAGEEGMRAAGGDWLCLRTQWLFGERGRSFPRTMATRAAARQPTKVVDDQFGRPTYTVDLAWATWKLVASGARGMYHVTNAGPDANWYDVAYAIFVRMGAEAQLTRCPSSDYPVPAKRPAYGVLDTTRLREAGVSMPEWPDALGRFLSTFAATTPAA